MTAGARLAFAIAAAVFGYGVASTYIDRLPDHRGLYLVPVDDAIAAPLPPPPRHTAVIVIDGLRRDGAESLAATRLIAAHGQCFTTDVGMLSVSRPVYAELSTGLEQDRTGSRNNDETSPLQVISLWEIARQAGRTVAGVSELSWWQQLFPRGFNTYEMPPRTADFFHRELRADLTLIHPIYVDETAHTYGGVSPEYTAAVARVDQEVTPFLQQIDWAQDLVVFTADHGHRARGGHGAPAPEIEFVLTCIAGRGVTHRPERGTIETRSLAPLLSILLGLHFPNTMRAGDDTLDALWPILSTLPELYLGDRHRALERFRQANRAALSAWGAPPGSWNAFYAWKHARQHRQWLGVGLMFAFALALPLPRLWARAMTVERERAGVRAHNWAQLRKQAVNSSLWTASVLGAVVVWEIALRGAFDFNAINERHAFVEGTLAASSLALLCGAVLQRFLFRQPLVHLQTFLVATLVTINLAHIAIYGWPVGFPLPAPWLCFLPFVSGIALMVSALCLVALSLRERFSRG